MIFNKVKKIKRIAAVLLVVVLAVFVLAGCNDETTSEDESASTGSLDFDPYEGFTPVTLDNGFTSIPIIFKDGSTSNVSSNVATADAGVTAGAVNTETVSLSGDFQVHFIDVGQGDAAVIICDGEAMLIDGGPSNKSDLIFAYLKQLGVTNLKYVIATHPDADHVGGIAGALNYIIKTEGGTLGEVYCSTTEYDTETFADFKKYTEQLGKTINIPEQGMVMTLGGATAVVLGPAEPGEDNNNSIVLRVSYGNTSFLFMGDAENEEEEMLLSSGQDLSCNVIKIAHHGSAQSTSAEFLTAANPAGAVISVGEDNSYGHPTTETLSLLNFAGITTFRTDMQGDIIFTSDGNNVSYTVEKNPDADVFKELKQ